jgi:hypothetical protein
VVVPYSCIAYCILYMMHHDMTHSRMSLWWHEKNVAADCRQHLSQIYFFCMCHLPLCRRLAAAEGIWKMKNSRRWMDSNGNR